MAADSDNEYDEEDFEEGDYDDDDETWGFTPVKKTEEKKKHSDADEGSFLNTPQQGSTQASARLIKDLRSFRASDSSKLVTVSHSSSCQ